MQLPEREQKLWDRIGAERASEGVPLAVCSTITPLPFWGVILAIVIFIPLALILSFFMKRQAVIVQGGRIVVLELGFWRFRVTGEPANLPLTPESVRLEGNALLVEDRKLHLQPGWGLSARRIVELAEIG
ncbi:MAG: hypothetical protein WBB30_11560 [Solirubrobacterales bacterium]